MGWVLMSAGFAALRFCRAWLRDGWPGTSLRGEDGVGEVGCFLQGLGPEARGVDEDKIRRVRRIDLLDPTIHGPRILDSRRA